MFASVLAFLARIGLGGIIEQAADVLKHRAEMQTGREKLRTELTAEYLRQIVEETRVMAEFNRAKLDFPWFWVFAGMFLVPLGMWWTAVILDSIFMFPWDVADLPTREMKDAAARMIEWVFYVGGGVAGVKALIR